MADSCLPLCAGEDTFELHSAQLELETVERRIHELLGKQAQLRKRIATLETSRADAHKSGVSMQRAANAPTTSTPCVSLHRPCAPGTRSSQMDFTPAPGNHGHWVQQRKTRSRPRATTSPSPVFDISSRNRFAPLCETDRDAVVIGDSIVRHVRATLAEGKVHTHCLPGAHVLDVSVQIPANMLSVSDAEKLVHAFMTSRLDYCNALLGGCPASSINKLQIVQNAVARVLTRSRKYDHITPILQSLHWLPIKFRISYKILLLAYKALNDLAPAYLTNLLSRYNPTRSLRSQNSSLLVVPRIAKSTKGGRTFSYLAPKLWNSLPENVRGSDTLSLFKSRLKTHLFSQAFI